MDQNGQMYMRKLYSYCHYYNTTLPNDKCVVKMNPISDNMFSNYKTE